MKKLLTHLFSVAILAAAIALPSAALLPAGHVSARQDKVTISCGNPADVCVNKLPRASGDGASVRRILTVVISIIAAIAVLFVAIGGLRYVMSQGDAQAVAKAKSTIIYAIVGIIICIFAQALVLLVVNTTT